MSRFLTRDNAGTFLRQGTADGVEARIGGYLDFGIHYPGHCVRVALPT
jgi:hypothetical protein